MKRLTKLISMILICAFAASLCSCANNNKQPETTAASETTAETTETTPAETAEAAPTPTPEPTPVPEPTVTPTPTPAPNKFTSAKAYSLMASTMGKTSDQTVKLVESFIGVPIGEGEFYKATNTYNYNVDVYVDGVHFNLVTYRIGKGKNKDKVIFISFANSGESLANYKTYYSKYTKILKKKYKKPIFKSKNKTITYSEYKVSKKYRTNTGWYYEKNNGNFWINFYLK